MTEEWRQVPDHPEYWVSSLGRVRCDDRVRPGGRWGGTQVFKGRHITPFPDTNGYLIIMIRGRKYAVHVLMLQTFIGRRPPKHVGAHYDDDRSNNRLSNLRWATHAENMADAARNRRIPLGEEKTGAILTWKEVDEIRHRHGGGEQQKLLAEEFGVSVWTIFKIVHHKMWVRRP
jgi:hypothetical protein